MSRENARNVRLAYLMFRLRRRQGNQDVLLREIVKAYNQRPSRRAGDVSRIQGWQIVEHLP